MEHLASAVDPFVFRFSIFVLAVFVGYFVVWSVTPALHTPLMSVTNAISSVIVVGALLAVGVSLAADDGGPVWARALGFVALILASVNIFGGFLVTQRMLAMYQKKKKVSAVMRLASVRIFVDDVETAAAFYENVVGLERAGSAPTAVLFGDSPSILVEAADDEARREGLLGRFTGMAFETDDAAALYRDLKARGVPLHGPPEMQTWGGVLLFAQDPSGNTISFVQYPAKRPDRRGS